MKRMILAGLLAVGVIAFAGGADESKFSKAQTALQKALALVAEVEPDREGPLSDAARGATVIIHTPNPEVIFVHPLDGDDLVGGEPLTLLVEINNWMVIPDHATSTATEFANGHHEHSTGHTHVWIYNVDTGARVRFTGATGLTEIGDTGIFESQPFTLPPGRYKAYVQLQNNDHTPPVQATPQSLPAIDSVVFRVVDPEL